MRRWISLWTLFFVSFTAWGEHAANMQRSMEIFKRSVRPYFLEHCLECHGGKKVKSAFNLNTRAGLLSGGDQGTVVLVGQPAESPLLAYLSHREEPHMPPKQPAISEARYRDLETWIRLGAAYDKPLGGAVVVEGPMIVTDEDRKFWAFAPLTRVTPPSVKNTGWVKNPIDQFIAEGHEREGLLPAKPLSRAAWMRRATYDLTGLPPTPQEVKAFEDDERPDAYAHVIRELLARPSFGERWARHWLDVARFAESHGFEHDYDRKNAFHYRDFVIQAFNQDMPWDQMVKWQLAGDELAPSEPQAMMATGFLGAGVYPTQITVAEAERIRYDAIDDMLATTGSAMLGLTIGCSRCHDHKYDPIPMIDYYRMAAAFTTTVRSDVDVSYPASPEALAAFNQTRKKLEARRKDFEDTQLSVRMQEWLKTQDAVGLEALNPWRVLSLDHIISKAGATMNKQADLSILVSGKNAGSDTYTVQARTGIRAVRALRIEALSHSSMVRKGPGRAGNGNFGLSNITLAWRPVGSNDAFKPLKLVNPRATFEQNKNNLSVAATIDNNATSGWAIDPQFGKDHAAVYGIAQAPQSDTPVEIQVVMNFQTNTQHNFGRFRVSVSEQVADGLPLRQDREMLAHAVAQVRGALQEGDEANARSIYRSMDAEWVKLDQAVEKHLASDPRNKKAKVMICGEGFKPMRHHVADGSIKDFYEETYVLHRGDVNQKREVAELGFLDVLTRHPDGEKNWMISKPANSKSSFRRAGLASWMTDTEYGAGHLLARVIVNRLWQHHFGEGLVPTANNFGFNGSPPRHPALLDWLANELIRNQWRLKPMHELMMSSATYEMGTSKRGENMIVDPENNWLWQREPRRLEAEAIRDAMLAVSGSLDSRMYGAGTLSESHKRRSIYFTVKRSKLVPFLQVFDFPDTLNSLGKRAVTTTSLQALVFMNHPEVRSMADAFATRLTRMEGDAVVNAYQYAFGRMPSASEATRAAQFIGEASLQDFCQALFSMNEFVYIP